MKPKVITTLFVLLVAVSMMAADAPAVDAQLTRMDPSGGLWKASASEEEGVMGYQAHTVAPP